MGEVVQRAQVAELVVVLVVRAVDQRRALVFRHAVRDSRRGSRYVVAVSTSGAAVSREVAAKVCYVVTSH